MCSWIFPHDAVIHAVNTDRQTPVLDTHQPQLDCGKQPWAGQHCMGYNSVLSQGCRQLFRSSGSVQVQLFRRRPLQDRYIALDQGTSYEVRQSGYETTIQQVQSRAELHMYNIRTHFDFVCVYIMLINYKPEIYNYIKKTWTSFCSSCLKNVGGGVSAPSSLPTYTLVSDVESGIN